MIRFYTDGSCIHNGRKDAKAGFAVIFPDRLEESWGHIIPPGCSPTNQTAELTAIYEGVCRAATLCGTPDSTTLRIYTDSEYSINCLTKWVAGWKKRGWKTSDGKPVIHREIIEKITEQLRRFGTHVFTHVKAHTGGQDEDSKWNQMADDFAKKAVEVGDRVTYDMMDVKVIRNPDAAVPALTGIPLAIMGPPIPEDTLVAALKEHLDVLDPIALKSALLTALKKTLTAKKYTLEKSKHGKVVHYRLLEESHLTVHRLEETTNDE